MGALVAVLAVHKDFADPLRELLLYYQIAEDVRFRYREMQKFVAGASGQQHRCPTRAAVAARRPVASADDIGL